jgi:hypothetical protein
VNVETDLKVGDVVTVKGNALFPDDIFQSKIVSIGQYPSMWLPFGEKRWGATFEATSLDEDGKNPMVYESSPMRAEQFWWFADHWEIQLR